MSELEWMFCHPKAEEFYGQDLNRSRPDDAGIDLRVMEEVSLEAGKCVTACSTGIKINISTPDMAGIILPRSGIGSRGIILGNSVGLIDCGYQGELLLTLWNRSSYYFCLSPGERVAQLVLIPVLHPALRKVARFKASHRGEDGFGSSGTM